MLPTSAYRERPIFGELDDLEELVKLSQFMQAEGLRYAIEAHRRRSGTSKPYRPDGTEPVFVFPYQRNIGAIVWQCNEPWPCVSCTCMVDYYGEPKLAYDFYRDAERPLHLSLRYGKLLQKQTINFKGGITLSILGNILWFICGGFISAISWFVYGLLWSITIIGLPVGAQCFKFAKLSCCPFGKDVIWDDGAVSFIVNILWIILSGVPLAIEHLMIGLIMCVTIVGIPFGLQHFKLAKLALMPFGAKVV